MLLRIVIVALATLFFAQLASAQELAEGARIRVDVTGELADDGTLSPGTRSQSIAARFLRMETDHLIVAVDSTSKIIRLPKAAITGVKVSRGRSRLRGGLIGAAVGGLGGVVWGAVERSRCQSSPHPFLCDLSFFGPLVLVPPVGTIVGVIIGKPQWEKMSPTAFAFGVLPVANGIQIAGTLKF